MAHYGFVAACVGISLPDRVKEAWVGDAFLDNKISVPLRLADLKAALYTVRIFICICMSLEVFRFAKNMKFLIKGEIRCTRRIFLEHFHCISGP